MSVLEHSHPSTSSFRMNHLVEAWDRYTGPIGAPMLEIGIAYTTTGWENHHVENNHNGIEHGPDT